MALEVKHTTSRSVATGGFEAGRFQHTSLSAKLIGKDVIVHNNCFSQTNHKIDRSRDFIPKDIKLRKFWYSSGLREVYFVYSFACIFAFLQFVVAAVVVIVSFLCSILFLQYMTVCCYTLPRVKKQPVIPGLGSLNDFVEININHLSAEYATAHNAGYGQLIAAKGTIKFQVFHPRVIGLMNEATNWSVIMFLMCLVQILWGCVFIYLGAANSGSLIGGLRW